MKILLLSPPYLPEYMRNARCDFVSLSGTQWFPIWLGYCGCFLEKHNYEVKLIDAPAYGLSHDQTEDIFLQHKPDLLVVYTGDKSEDNDIEFTERLLSKHECLSVLVGPYFSISPKESLAKSTKIPFGIVGEFEHPILEILHGKPPAEVKNLLWRKDGQIISNEIRPYVSGTELDTFPSVSEFFHRHLDFKYYRAPSEFHPFVDIMTGRGCVWGVCTFCLWVNSFIKGRVYNARSIDNVIEEIAFIEQKMPYVKSIMIQDDTFPADRARKFCEEKLKKGLKISWSCYSRADIDYDTLLLMKNAGCRNLHVGYESANNEVLKKMRKGLNKEQMTRFTQDAKKAGLRIHGDFAIGFPGETEDTVKETIQWACELRPHTAQFQLIIPFRETPCYNELKQNGFLKDGAPDFPHLTRDRMEQLAKSAYRKFYLSFPYLLQAIIYPQEHIFNHLKTFRRAIPAMFWRKWNVR